MTKNDSKQYPNTVFFSFFDSFHQPRETIHDMLPLQLCRFAIFSNYTQFPCYLLSSIVILFVCHFLFPYTSELGWFGWPYLIWFTMEAIGFVSLLFLNSSCRCHLTFLFTCPSFPHISPLTSSLPFFTILRWRLPCSRSLYSVCPTTDQMNAEITATDWTATRLGPKEYSGGLKSGLVAVSYHLQRWHYLCLSSLCLSLGQHITALFAIYGFVYVLALGLIFYFYSRLLFPIIVFLHSFLFLLSSFPLFLRWYPSCCPRFFNKGDQRPRLVYDS
jgi:hypothetical protein